MTSRGIFPRHGAQSIRMTSRNYVQPPPPSTKPEEGSPTFWMTWNKRQMVRYPMTPLPPAISGNVDPKVQIAPPRDLVFILTALWKELTVGSRLASWEPSGTACALDGASETVQRATTQCKFLTAAFHIARQCIGPIKLEDDTVDDAETILWEQPALSVSSPLGLMGLATGTVIVALLAAAVLYCVVLCCAVLCCGVLCWCFRREK